MPPSAPKLPAAPLVPRPPAGSSGVSATATAPAAAVGAASAAAATVRGRRQRRMTQFQLSAPAGMGQSSDPGDPSSALQALMAQMGAPMPTGTAHPQGHADAVVTSRDEIALEKKRPGKVAQPFILGRLTVRVVEGKGLRGPGNSMIFRPYVRVSLVEQKADAQGNVVGGGDAVMTSEFASVGGRNPKWNLANPSNTMAFPFQMRVGGRLVLVIEGCEQDVDAKEGSTFGMRRVFGVGGLDLSNVVSAVSRAERVVTADLFDEGGQESRGSVCIQLRVADKDLGSEGSGGGDPATSSTSPQGSSPGAADRNPDPSDEPRKPARSVPHGGTSTPTLAPAPVRSGLSAPHTLGRGAQPHHPAYAHPSALGMDGGAGGGGAPASVGSTGAPPPPARGPGLRAAGGGVDSGLGDRGETPSPSYTPPVDDQEVQQEAQDGEVETSWTRPRSTADAGPVSAPSSVEDLGAHVRGDGPDDGDTGDVEDRARNQSSDAYEDEEFQAESDHESVPDVSEVRVSICPLELRGFGSESSGWEANPTVSLSVMGLSGTRIVGFKSAPAPEAEGDMCRWSWTDAASPQAQCQIPPSPVRMLMVEVRSGTHLVGLATADVNLHVEECVAKAADSTMLELNVSTPFNKTAVSVITLLFQVLGPSDTRE